MHILDTETNVITTLKGRGFNNKAVADDEEWKITWDEKFLRSKGYVQMKCFKYCVSKYHQMSIYLYIIIIKF